MDEAVFFIFHKDGKFLLEHRLPESEEPNKIFLPCGGIEVADHGKTEDYRIVAMKREISEELGNGISIRDFTFLTTVEVAETMKMYHSYVIHDWKGELPLESKELGIANATLVWTDMDQAFLTIDSEVARMTVGRAIAALRDGSYRDRV